METLLPQVNLQLWKYISGNHGYSKQRLSQMFSDISKIKKDTVPSQSLKTVPCTVLFNYKEVNRKGKQTADEIVWECVR